MKIFVCSTFHSLDPLASSNSEAKGKKGKGKVSCALTEHHDMKAYWGSGGSSTHSMTSALDGGERSASRPGRFTLKERAPGTHWIGGWVGPRAVLDVVVKRKIPSPHRESKPRTSIITFETMNPFRHFGRTPISRPPPTQEGTTHTNENIHSYLEWDSNPISQSLSGPRLYARSTVRPLRVAQRYLQFKNRNSTWSKMIQIAVSSSEVILSKLIYGSIRFYHLKAELNFVVMSAVKITFL
jgi:hypothetical protein